VPSGYGYLSEQPGGKLSRVPFSTRGDDADIVDFVGNFILARVANNYRLYEEDLYSSTNTSEAFVNRGPVVRDANRKIRTFANRAAAEQWALEETGRHQVFRQKRDLAFALKWRAQGKESELSERLQGLLEQHDASPTSASTSPSQELVLIPVSAITPPPNREQRTRVPSEIVVEETLPSSLRHASVIVGEARLIAKYPQLSAELLRETVIRSEVSVSGWTEQVESFATRVGVSRGAMFNYLRDGVIYSQKASMRAIWGEAIKTGVLEGRMIGANTPNSSEKS
jgi:hypothetical protein